MQDFPVELIDAIISYIRSDDYPTLCTLCLTSRTFHFLAEKVLYSSMTSRVSFSLQSGFLATIDQLPRLAEHVREYDLFSLSSRNVDPKFNLWERTAKGLIAMKNLKIVVFQDVHLGPPRAGLLDMDRGVTFQLERLFWRSEANEYLQKVLEQQRHTLLELRFGLSEKDTFSPILYPGLERLSGDLHVLESFLIGSRVTHLEWTVSKREESIPSEELRARLQKLKGHLAVVRTFNLQCMSYGPSLGVFQGLLDHTEVWQVAQGSKSNCFQELHVLKNFPSLREFVLSSSHPNDPSPIPLEGREQVIGQLFEDCPKLMVVDIQHILHRNRDVVLYSRWKRGSLVPIQLTDAEVKEGRFRTLYWYEDLTG